MRRFLFIFLVLLAGWFAFVSTAVAHAEPGSRRGTRPAGLGWVWPLAGPHRVVEPFRPPRQQWLPGHRGVDLAGRPREPVRATAAGVVSFAGTVAGIPVVSVRHPDGLLTTYEPVRASVRAGQRVTGGQRLGRLVPSGSHCPPRTCLHWGLRRGRDYLDPLSLVGPRRVRLLPLGAARAGPGWTGLSVGSGVMVTGLLFGWRRRRGRGLAEVVPLDVARRRRRQRGVRVTAPWAR